MRMGTQQQQLYKPELCWLAVSNEGCHQPAQLHRSVILSTAQLCWLMTAFVDNSLRVRFHPRSVDCLFGPKRPTSRLIGIYAVHKSAETVSNCSAQHDKSKPYGTRSMLSTDLRCLSSSQHYPVLNIFKTRFPGTEADIWHKTYPESQSIFIFPSSAVNSFCIKRLLDCQLRFRNLNLDTSNKHTELS